MGVQASIYPIHIHVPSLWKNGPIHLLHHPKCWPIHILPFDFFCTHLLLEVRQISQSIHWIPREQAASKNLWAKICAYTRMSEKWAFYIGIQKNRVIYILFVEKRGPIIYLAALKKGAIRHAHPYYAIYRKLPPSFYPRVKSSIPYLVCKKEFLFQG